MAIPVHTAVGCCSRPEELMRDSGTAGQGTLSAQSLSLTSVVALQVMMVPPDPLNRHILPCRLA